MSSQAHTSQSQSGFPSSSSSPRIIISSEQWTRVCPRVAPCRVCVCARWASRGQCGSDNRPGSVQWGGAGRQTQHYNIALHCHIVMLNMWVTSSCEVTFYVRYLSDFISNQYSVALNSGSNVWAFMKCWQLASLNINTTHMRLNVCLFQCKISK